MPGIAPARLAALALVGCAGAGWADSECPPWFPWVAGAGAAVLAGGAGVYLASLRRDGKAAARLAAERTADLARAKDEIETGRNRLHRQLDVLGELTRGTLLDGADTAAAVRRLTAAVARALGVERVGVWELDPAAGELRCADLYELTPDRHTPGAVLPTAPFPAYFAALATARVVAADDARTDPRTSEFAPGYLIPYRIGAMMDAPVLLAGDRVHGTICCEHVGGPRAWTPDEQTFAVAAANLVALVLQDARRRRAEADLAAREERYRALVEHAFDAVTCYDAAGRITYVSPNNARLDGRTADENLGFSAFDHLHPDDRDRGRDILCAVLAHPDRRFPARARFVHKDGRVRWGDGVIRNLLADPAVGAIVLNWRDVTEQVAAEQALAASEAKNRAILRALPDLVFLLDAAGRFADFHTPDPALLYCPPAAFLGRTVTDALPDPPAAALAATAAAVQRTRAPAEVRYVLPDAAGEDRYYHARFVPADPDGVLVVVQDETARRVAEIALRASEERFRDFFDLSEDLFGISDFTGRFVRVSPGFVRTLGYTEAEWTGRPFLDFVHPADRAATEAEAYRLLDGGAPRVFENRYVAADGSARWLQWRVTVRHAEQLTYAVGRDVTAARAAAELMEQTHRAARVGGWELDIPTDRLTWTAETYRLHDTTPEAFTPTVESALAFYTPDHRAVVRDAVRRAVEAGAEWSLELELDTAAGRRIWVNAVGRVVVADGRPVKALGSLQDVTDRKRAELALQRANEELETRVRERTAALETAVARLRESQTIAGIGSFRWDAAADTLSWSDELFRIYGVSPDAFTPTLAGYLGMVHPDHLDAVKAAVGGAMATGGEFAHDYRIVRPDGEVRWVHARGRAAVGPGGAAAGLEGVCQDVTDRRAAADALRASEAFTRAIIDAEPECVKVIDPGCRLAGMNPAGLKLVEAATPEQVLGIDIPQFLLPEYRDAYRAAVDGAFAGIHTVVEYEFVGLGGRRRRMEQHAAPIPDPDQPGKVTRVIGVSRDITDRAAAEEALRRSEELNRAVLNSLEAHIAVVDRDGTVRAVNDAWTRFAAANARPGRAPAAAGVGANYLAVCRAGADAAVLAGMKGVLDGTAPEFRRDYPCDAPGRPRWFRMTATPLAGAAGGAVVAHADITDLKRAEADARASAREKEALLKEVHHRVKNNLQIVISLLNLRADGPADPPTLAALRESRDRVRSMALIHETLYRSASLARLDLAAYVEALCDQLVRSYATDPARVRLAPRVAPLALDLDRAIPAGLLLNELVSNALKHAFPGDRTGTVAVALAADPPGSVTLEVTDDGVGLPPGFDPRQTDTLGLQLVATLARQLDGTFELTGGPGGARARVVFPG